MAIRRGERSSTPPGVGDKCQHHVNEVQSSTKLPKLQKGLSHDNVIRTPRRPSKDLKNASTDQTPLPCLDAQRTRGSLRSRTKVNYDMRFHPADKVLRPNHAATRAARRTSSENEPEVDGKVSIHDDRENKDTDKEDDMSKRSPKQEVVLEAIHHFTRTGRQVKAANYDMKRHPMDDTLRPKAAAKRSVRFQGLPSSPTDSKFEPTDVGISSIDIPFLSVASVNDNLFQKPLLGEWNELSDLDRRLYQLQHGAPPESELLPLNWSEVVTRLVEENLLTMEQLGAYGGYAALEARYEEVRLAVRESFGPNVDEEPKHKNELQWMYMESAYIFDFPSGHKYWRHQCESVVTQSCENDSKIQLPLSTENSEEPLRSNVEEPVEGQITLPEPEESLMQSLANKISVSIQAFMSEDEVDELISQQEGQRKRPVNVGSVDSIESMNRERGIAAWSSESDGSQLSPNAPPGVRRAAHRMRKIKREKRQRELLEAGDKAEEENNWQSTMQASKDHEPVVDAALRSQSFAVVINQRRHFSAIVGQVHQDQPKQTPVSGSRAPASPMVSDIRSLKKTTNEEIDNDTQSSRDDSSTTPTRGEPILGIEAPDISSAAAAANAFLMSYQSILEPPKPAIPLTHSPSYSVDPTATIFTAVNGARVRPVATDFFAG